MIKLRDTYDDPIEISVTSDNEILIDDTCACANLKFTPAQARELAAASIECANKIQRKGDK
ncbi:hypothetical protein NVP1076O_17 [Vibrio phage 1.076.O._10N.286.51.B7]|nr:hypothetical protein NVP1076O_17 [Vibrio phage 1.076.O._10N.286.51.B7]